MLTTNSLFLSAHSENEKTENSNFIDQKITLPTDGLACSGDLLPSKSFSDSDQQPMSPSPPTEPHQQAGGQLLSPNEINVMPSHHCRSSNSPTYRLWPFFLSTDLCNIESTTNQIHHDEDTDAERM